MNRIFLLFILLNIILLPDCFSQWSQSNVPLNIDFLLSIDFADINHGASCGWHQNNGVAIYTTNSGINWSTSQVPDSSHALVTIQFINPQTGFIAGAYNTSVYPKMKIYSTKHSSLSKGVIRKYYEKIGLNDAIMYRGLLLKTTNSGASWFTYGSVPDNMFYLIGMFFNDANTGYVTADKDTASGQAAILKTTNGGLTWGVQGIPDSINTLWNIYFVDNNTGFSYGYKQLNDTTFTSVLLRTSNGGVVWDEYNFSNMENILDLNFSSSSMGFLVGTSLSSYIYNTSNTGLNWTQLNSPLNNAKYEGIRFVYGTGTGMIFGEHYDSVPSITKLFVSKTGDYGQSWWNNITNISNAILTYGCIVDQNNWYLCGGNFGGPALILRTSNGGNPIGIDKLSEKFPNVYTLEQNYPNPFNPKTTLKYSLPKNSFVKLRIYDVVGRVIAILVNEHQKQGSYEVDFDGSEFASGIYFYKLQTEYFRETRKMVMTK